MFQQVLTFLTLGLGEGALIAAIGLGVVLTYRGSGVVNFATGAMAMTALNVLESTTADCRAA